MLLADFLQFILLLRREHSHTLLHGLFSMLMELLFPVGVAQLAVAANLVGLLLRLSADLAELLTLLGCEVQTSGQHLCLLTAGSPAHSAALLPGSVRVALTLPRALVRPLPLLLSGDTQR